VLAAARPDWPVAAGRAAAPEAASPNTVVAAVAATATARRNRGSDRGTREG
jgi:hypothetical protein